MIFLANENFPKASILLLREHSYQIISITKESPGIKDDQVWSRAVDEKLIILTFDRDYGALIYQQKLPSPQGIIYFRYQPLTPTTPAQQLLELFKMKEIKLNQFFTIIEPNNLRQRPLP